MASADVSAPQLVSPRSPGRIVPFGKYLLLQRVSVGGMAEIFKAVPEGARRLDNILAIKRILPSIAEDDEFIGMFRDEARIAGQLTHPNICRIYELGKVGDTNYIAMQFLWGRDLLKVINRFKRVGRNTPPPLVTYVGAKACAGLHYAHTKRDASGQPLNIIHRDVSPQNISLGYSGQVKLIDFGVARAASQSQKTQAGVLKGKFGYMSPEMVKGFEIDARSDVFAMGICLWEALTGQRLFYGESDFATLELVREAQVAAPGTKVADIPRELDEVVMRALAAEPDDRYQSAAELQSALDEVLALHYAGFNQSDVAVIMQQAFALEVKRERQRLSSFEDMMAKGNLVRGAELPALPAEPPTSGDRPAGTTTESGGTQLDSETVVHAVSDEELERLSGSFEAVHDEPTTIFFSADELEEIAELASGEEEVEEHNPLEVAQSSEQRLPAPHATQLLMPGPPVSPESRLEAQQWTDLTAFEGLPTDSNFPSAPPPPPPPPSYPSRLDYTPPPASPDYLLSSNGPPSETVEFPLESPEADEPREQHRSATVWLVLLAVLIGMITYFGLRSLRASTGELTVDVTGPDRAVIRVDGVLRGHHPLHIDDLAPGSHQVDVEASGFQSVQREVAIERGRATLVRLVMLPWDGKGQTASATTGARVEAVPTAEPRVNTEAAAASAETGGGAREAEPARAAPRRDRPAPRRTPSEPSRDWGSSTASEPAAPPEATETQQPPQEPADIEEPPAREPEVAEVAEPEPQPPPSAANAFPPRAPAEPATLMISTLPWSRVFVDGTDTGKDTPVRDLEIPPGKHKIGLRTPDGKMHVVDIVAKPGQSSRIIRRFPTLDARL